MMTVEGRPVRRSTEQRSKEDDALHREAGGSLTQIGNT